MSSLSNLLNGAVYSKLSGGTALTSLLGGTVLFAGHAPDGQAAPYVVWNIQAGGNENLTPHETWNGVVFVRGFSGVSGMAAGSIDVQLDALLHKQPLSVSGWTNIWMVREQDMALDQSLPNGKWLYMRGGMYRIILAQ